MLYYTQFHWPLRFNKESQLHSEVTNLNEFDGEGFGCNKAGDILGTRTLFDDSITSYKSCLHIWEDPVYEGWVFGEGIGGSTIFLSYILHFLSTGNFDEKNTETRLKMIKRSSWNSASLAIYANNL